jgi:membrane associated rhomboid family serine protease
MIPLRDVVPSRTTPVATLTILGVNTLVFVYEQTLSQQELTRFVAEFGLVPVAFRWAAVVPSMFLHAGWLHFLVNMLYLWLFGDNVEDRLGHGRFVIFYLLCGTAAALAQATTTHYSYVPMVGASGAIGGVMAAYFVLFPHSRILTLVPLILNWDVVEVPALFFLGLWLILQLLTGVGSLAVQIQDIGGVAFWAHAAGFITGVAGVFLLRRPERQRVEWWS